MFGVQASFSPSITPHGRTADAIGRYRQQHQDLSGVLGRSFEAHLHVAELAFEDPERVLDLGTDAGLAALDLPGRLSC